MGERPNGSQAKGTQTSELAVGRCDRIASSEASPPVAETVFRPANSLIVDVLKLELRWEDKRKQA